MGHQLPRRAVLTACRSGSVWKADPVGRRSELDAFLLARATEHDSPSLLFRLDREYLRSAKVVRPGVVTLPEKVGIARQAAERETRAVASCANRSGLRRAFRAAE
jgi:hypothetical protein